MKVSMSNREYSKVRKHFRTMFKNGDLTKEVCQSEEYLNFEKEENKRKRAKQLVNEWLEKREKSPEFKDLRNKMDLFLEKYEYLSKRADKLAREVLDLSSENKIDNKTVSEFANDKCMNFEKSDKMVGYVLTAFFAYIKTMEGPFSPKINSEEKYKKEYEQAFLYLRRETCAFSTALNKAEKKLADIKARLEEFIKARKIEKTREKAGDKAKSLEREFSNRKWLSR